MFTFPFTMMSGEAAEPAFNTKSFSLDGVNEFFNMGNDSSLNITGPLSISMWIKPTSLAALGGLLCKWGSSGSRQIRLYHIGSDNSATDGSIHFQITSSGTTTYARAETVGGMTAGWNHIVATFGNDATKIRIYINGVEPSYTSVVNTSTSIFVASGDFGLGTYTTGAAANNSYDGLMDEVTVWDTTRLSGADAVTLYNSGVPSDPTAASVSGNLVTWLRMGDDPADDGTGTTGVINDQVGVNDAIPVNTESGDISSDVP